MSNWHETNIREQVALARAIQRDNNGRSDTYANLVSIAIKAVRLAELVLNEHEGEPCIESHPD